jgi:hypothetical protein
LKNRPKNLELAERLKNKRRLDSKDKNKPSETKNGKNFSEIDEKFSKDPDPSNQLTLTNY